MSQDTPTWEPRRERLAARLPGCLVELPEPQLLRVVVPYADRPELTLRLGEPEWDERAGDWWLCSPASIDALVSHVFCMCFEETYSYDKWPPERVRALLGGPFDAHARATARHFADVLSSSEAPIRRRATQWVLQVSREVEEGTRFPVALDMALRHRDGEYARADDTLALARAYRALAEAPHPAPAEPTP